MSINIISYDRRNEMSAFSVEQSRKFAVDVLEYMASDDSFVGSVVIGNSSPIGTFTDSVRQGGSGSQEIDILYNTYTLSQIDVATPRDGDLDPPMLVGLSTSANSTILQEGLSTKEQIADFIINTAVTTGPFCYHLGTSAPTDGGVWINKGALLDTLENFTVTQNQYYLWKKITTGSNNSYNRPIKLADGALTVCDYSDIKRFAKIVEQRILSTGISKYVIQHSVPTEGVWSNAGTITDTRRIASLQAFTGSVLYDGPGISYLGAGEESYVGVTPVSYSGITPANFVGPTPASYFGVTPANFFGTTPANFTGTIPANFTGTIPANFAGTIPANFAGPGLYLGAEIYPARFLDTFFLQTYQGTTPAPGGGSFDPVLAQYDGYPSYESTISYPANFDGGPANFAGTTPANFAGTTPANFAGTTPVAYTGTVPATYAGTTPATFIGTIFTNFFGTTPANFIGTVPATYVGTNPNLNTFYGTVITETGYTGTLSTNYYGMTPAEFYGSTQTVSYGTVPAEFSGTVPAIFYGASPTTYYGTTPATYNSTVPASYVGIDTSVPIVGVYFSEQLYYGDIISSSTEAVTTTTLWKRIA